MMVWGVSKHNQSGISHWWRLQEPVQEYFAACYRIMPIRADELIPSEQQRKCPRCAVVMQRAMVKREKT